MRSKQHNFMDTIQQVFDDAIQRGVAYQSTDEVHRDRRTLTVAGRRVTHFASSSYMALETDPRLIDALKAAAEHFGTQFSSSRPHLALGLYGVLENKIAQIFDRPAMVGTSPSALHLAALPALVGIDDIVFLDQRANASLQQAAQLLKARGVPLALVHHNRPDELEARVAEVKGKHARVWYVADGVYSTFGDCAPTAELLAIAKRHDNVWLYIDDSHGMGWTGPRGCGYVHERMGGAAKLVLTVSLGHSFAATGAALVLPSQELAQRVRACTGTMVDAAPIAPPMLAASVASAELHLSPDFPALQADLAQLIRLTNDTLHSMGLPQLHASETPLFFIPVGLPKLVYGLISELRDAGYQLKPGVFPAVTMARGGVQFAITRHLQAADIHAMLTCLHAAYARMATRADITPELLAEAFASPHLAACDWRIERTSSTPTSPPLAADARPPVWSPSGSLAKKSRLGTAQDLRIRTMDRLSEADRPRWNALFAGRGPMSADILDMLARVFCIEGDDGPGRVTLGIVWIEDQQGEPVLATFYITALIKDDMFERVEVSHALEAVRQKDPLYMTSRAVIMGSPASAGSYLYLDRDHPKWRESVAMLVEELKVVMKRERAARVILRDFIQGTDDEFRDVMLENGLFEFRLPDRLYLADLRWRDRDEYLKRLSRKYRYHVRQDALAFEDRFIVDTAKPTSRGEIEACYQLYLQVWQRSAEVNMFPMPIEYFEAIGAEPSYDVIRLYLKDGDAKSSRSPVAVMFSHVQGKRYGSLTVGIDYAYLHSHKVYKQIMYQTVQRAHSLGCETLCMGYTASLEKKKLGARPEPTCAYVMLDDHFSIDFMNCVA